MAIQLNSVKFNNRLQVVTPDTVSNFYGKIRLTILNDGRHVFFKLILYVSNTAKYIDIILCYFYVQVIVY